MSGAPTTDTVLRNAHDWKDRAVWTPEGYYLLQTADVGDVPVRLFLTPSLLAELEDDVYRQIVNAARFPGVRLVVITPDAHVGYGVPVGSVIVTDGARGALAMGPVGFDIGCFAGDTLVPLLDGRTESVRALAERGGEHWIFALTPEHRVAAAKGVARLTRRDASLVRVRLDNGCEIVCTPDHLFMRRDGTWCEAKQLTAGMSLMPLYRREARGGYHVVKHPATGSWQVVHWIVARQGLLGLIPRFPDQKTVIHHRNFSPSDNCPDNLAFMGDQDHLRYHHANGWHNLAQHRDTIEPARLAALAAKAQTPEGRAYFAERGTRNILRYMQERPEHFRESVKGNGRRGREALIRYNRNDKGRKKSREIARREYVCETCGEGCRSGLGIHNHRRWRHGYNHTVMSVEALDRTEDVYCMTVPEFGNFALDAGVFVHNCGMMSARSSVPATEASYEQRLAFNRAVMHRVEMGVGGKRKRHRLGTISRGEFERLVRGGAEYYIRRYGATFDRSHAERHRIPVDDDWQIPWGGKGKPERGIEELGSLGGGNHFIELQCCEETGTLFVQVHTGSRGFGHGLATNYFELARAERPREITQLDLGYFLPDSPHYRDYLNAVAAGGNYAILNRLIIYEQVAEAFREVFGADLELIYEISHNLVQREWHPDFGEVWVHRKGATRALPAGHPFLAGTMWEHEGHPVLIPGSNKDYSYVLRPLPGAVKSAYSVNHGAGRRISRSAAVRQLSQEAINVEYRTAGIPVNVAAPVPIDEAAPCYKPSREVIAAVVGAGLARVEYSLWPLASLKGTETRARHRRAREKGGGVGQT